MSFSRKVVSDQCSTAPGQGKRSQEVAQVVGHGVQLKTRLVVAKAMAREPRLVDGVFAFLDILPRRAPAIVEPCHTLGGPPQVGHDKADTGNQFAGMPPELRSLATQALATTRRFLSKLPAW